jgi:hypothetical protein
MPFPQDQFARMAAPLPPHPAWLLPGAAIVALALGTAAIAFHQPWAGAVLLLLGVLAAGLASADMVLALGLLAVPFGFGLADPARALAAMFVTFALAVLTVLLKSVSVVHWAAAAAFILAAIFPDRFSLLSYLIGIAAFVAAGQGALRGRA